MGLKDHLDDGTGTGHTLDLGLDLDYLHVKAVERGPCRVDAGGVDRGSSDNSARGSSVSPGDSEESSAGSDSEAEQGRAVADGNLLPPEDTAARSAHPQLCRSPRLDRDSPGLPDAALPEPRPACTLREYQSKVEFALKLGYGGELVRLVLGKLGPDALINDLLGELVKLGSKAEGGEGGGAQPASHAASSSSICSSSSSSSSACGFSDSMDSRRSDSPSQADVLDDKDNLRPVVVDGSNVAMSHGNKEVFSCHGIQLAVDWFLERGHKDITVFVPAWRKEQSRPDALITDQEVLRRLEKDKILVFTPSRRVQGRRVVCYDDRFIVKLAYESDGIIVSNDNYRDLANEKPEWKKFIDERLLMYSFVNDKFMPPDDPLGRHGPSLENFLRKRPIVPEHKKQPCPYGKKCTYGHKCKFYHPERGTQPQRSVADELRASAKSSAAKGLGEAGLVKSHSVPSGSRADRAPADGKRAHPKRPAEAGARALSYSDVEDKLSARTKADAHRSGPALPPAPGGPPSGHGCPQDPRGDPGPAYPTCESPDLSYYSLVRAYSGLGLPPSAQRSPERSAAMLLARFPGDGGLSSVASDCSSEGSDGSYGAAGHAERSCMSSPDSLLDDGLCHHHHHHQNHHHHAPARRPYPHPPASSATTPGYHPGLARGHSFARDEPPAEPARFLQRPSLAYLQHPPAGGRASCPGDRPPPGRGLASTRAESASDSRLYELSPRRPRTPPAYPPGPERPAGWELCYRPPPQPRYEPFAFQSLPEKREPAWRSAWGPPAPPPHPSHAPRPPPQQAEPPSVSHYQEVRETVFINLCNIFPTELVRLVMGRYPHVTDAQRLAAAILAEKGQPGY